MICGRANHGGARCFRRACSTQKAEHLHSQCAVIWMPFLTEDHHTVGTTHAKPAKDGTKSSRIITDHPGSSIVRADFSHNLRTRHCCITPACAHMEMGIGPNLMRHYQQCPCLLLVFNLKNSVQKKNTIAIPFHDICRFSLKPTLFPSGHPKLT